MGSHYTGSETPIEHHGSDVLVKSRRHFSLDRVDINNLRKRKGTDLIPSQKRWLINLEIWEKEPQSDPSKRVWLRCSIAGCSVVVVVK